MKLVKKLGDAFQIVVPISVGEDTDRGWPVVGVSTDHLGMGQFGMHPQFGTNTRIILS